MLDHIKQLREETGAPLGEIKKALQASGGNTEKAKILLRRHGGLILSKRASRQTKAGIVEAYIHSNGKVGVLLELLSESDFVARNQAFKELAHDLAMQVAAMDPQFVSSKDVTQEVKDSLYEMFARETETAGKSDSIKKQIVEGKIEKLIQEQSLMEQPFIKDQSKTVGEIIQEAAGKFGEKIRIGKFARFQL